MEPLGYVQVAKRWWWLIAGLVLAAVVMIYATTPARFVDRYEATHVLLVEGDSESGRNSEANPEVVALWAKESEVLTRAAAAIGPAVGADQLGRDISVDTNRNVGTVSVTASDLSPQRAALKATTVANTTVQFLTEREAARQQAAQTELATQEETLRARIAELEASIANNPLDIETQTAERDAAIRQLGTVLEAQDAGSATVVYTTLDEPERGAKQDRLPGTRTRTERMLLAAVVAMVLGFGLALTLDRSDTRVRSRRAAEEHFGLPVIAEIVKFPFWTRRRQLTVARQPDTAVAESYRTLRSALMLLARPAAAEREDAFDHVPGTNGGPPEPRGDVIMITSAGSGDGKSTTVANLAAAYGESGRSVLVLCLDLHRRRRIRRRRRSKAARAPGVTEYLAADTPIPLASLVMGSKVPGVRRVGTGSAARPPGGQLDAQQRLLDEARALADVVLVDTAPLLASSVNRELATMVDSVVALCRAGRTTTAQAERFGDLLAQMGAPAVGVVMIGTTAPEGSEYFAYFTLRRDRRTETTDEAGAPVDDAAPAATDESSDVEQTSTEPANARSENGHAGEPSRRDVSVDDR